MKKILVTGGAGFIGSHVALALHDAGESVVILDNLSTGKREAAPIGEYIEFVEGDVGDEVLVENLVREHEIEEVIHLAAYVDVAESVRDPEKYRLNNLENTKKLLGAAKRGGVQRFVFSSTAAVYGTPKETPVDENAATKPESPYGEYKLEAEKAVKESALFYVILRYFNVAGTDPQGRAGYVVKASATHLIRRAVLAATGGLERLQVFGSDYPTPDGTCVRDFIHVSDLSNAHVKALEYMRKGGEPNTFNVGTGKGYSVLEVLKTVRNLSASDLQWEFAPRREGDSVAVVADPNRIKKVLGWKSVLSLPDMVRDELRWVRLQQNTI